MRPGLFDRARPRSRDRGAHRLARGEGAPEAAIQPTDIDVGRAQAAGGPVDLATYTCSCGLLFSAPVSTTVACPHCGCEQAW
jgi:hypothetical protein